MRSSAKVLRFFPSTTAVQVKILDLQGGTAILRVDPAVLPKVNAIKTYPLTTPTWVKVRLSTVTSDSIEGQALDTRD